MLTRFAIAAALVAAFSTQAVAQGRPDARAMTCDQVQSMLIERGEVVMTTGPHLYDRYVGNRSLCSYPETAMQVRVQTRDTDRCIVYNCQRSGLDDWRIR